MAFFAELGTETQIVAAPYVRAVGWLSSEHRFATGQLAPAFVTKLREMCRLWGSGLEALGWPVAGGFHTCEVCGNVRATGNLGVPGSGVLFVAPEMVAHYVADHSYAPPPEFVEAVLRSPVPGTQEYEQAVRAVIGDTG
jgi:hypothetical protein